MKPTPKTIQIFLPGGEPQGIRIAEVTTRIIKAIEVPRSLLSDFFAMPEASQVGVYFLFGENEDGNPQIYVGQTSNVKLRLGSHNRKKEFWDRAVVIISRTNSLTQTHAVFLEWFCLKECRTVGRFQDENGNSASKPHTPPPLEADCLEIFDTLKTLVGTLGYPAFESIIKHVDESQDKETYICDRREAQGKGLFTPEGFVILSGSRGLSDLTPSAGDLLHRRRERLINNGVAKYEGGAFVFEKDYLFRSPSSAASVLMGRRANGWTSWKLPDGRTLDEVKRTAEEE